MLNKDVAACLGLLRGRHSAGSWQAVMHAMAPLVVLLMVACSAYSTLAVQWISWQAVMHATSRSVVLASGCMQGIQHLGSAMGCFMRMKGINFHEVDTAPSTQSVGAVTAKGEDQASILPPIIQSEAVSISPVVLCPAATSAAADLTNSNKRQKVEVTTSTPVSSRQPGN